MIIGALQLARERVTADDLRVKGERRATIAGLLSRIGASITSGAGLPPAGEIRAVLGDDDPAVRRALEGWDPQ